MSTTITGRRVELLRSIESLRYAPEPHRQWHYDRSLAALYAVLAEIEKEGQANG